MKIKILFAAFVCAVSLTSCAQAEKNVEMDNIKERITKEIQLEQPETTDIKENNAAAERYGIPLSKIEEGFVYGNKDNVKSADEIIVVKVKNKKDISEVERALEAEITGLSAAWEGADKAQFEKVQKHILRSKGKYVLLSICDDNRKVEELFNSLMG